MLQPRLQPFLLPCTRCSGRVAAVSSSQTSTRFFSSSLTKTTQTHHLKYRPRTLQLLQSTNIRLSSVSSLPFHRNFSKSSLRLQDAQQEAARFVYPESLVIYHGGTARTAFLGMLKFGVLMGAVFVVVVIAPALYRAGHPLWKPAAVITCAMVPVAFTLFSTNPQVAFLRLRLPRFARTSSEMLRRYAEAPPANAVVEIGVLNFHGRPRVIAVPLTRLAPASERFGLVNWAITDDAASAARKRLMFDDTSSWRRWLRRRPLEKLSIRENSNDAKEAWVWDAVAAAAGRRNR